MSVMSKGVSYGVTEAPCVVCFYPNSSLFRLVASQANSIFFRLTFQKFWRKTQVLVVICGALHLLCGDVSNYKLVPESSKARAASDQRCSSVLHYQTEVLFAFVVSIDLVDPPQGLGIDDLEWPEQSSWRERMASHVERGAVWMRKCRMLCYIWRKQQGLDFS